MSEFGGGSEPDYRANKQAFRAAIVADGGLMGLFDRIRVSDESFLAAMDQYNPLLYAAVTPAEKAWNAVLAEETNADPNKVNDPDEEYMDFAAVEGIRPEDVSSLLVAVMLCQTAFPGVPLGELPTDMMALAEVTERYSLDSFIV